MIDSTQQYLDAAGLSFDTDVPNPLPTVNLPPELRTQLSLIVKEAVRNVVEHAGAKTVSLRLSIRDGTLTLFLADDGCGFEIPPVPEAASRPAANGRGHGFPNLRARAEAVGGKLEIISRPGAGTTITVTAPCLPK